LYCLGTSWVVTELSAEQAFGRVHDPDRGRGDAFAIEAWVPCDPQIARDLDDSDERRYLLPRVGEPVEVAWKLVPSRVARKLAVEQVLPRRT
jgi:hypothetical protein